MRPATGGKNGSSHQQRRLILALMSLIALASVPLLFAQTRRFGRRAPSGQSQMLRPKPELQADPGRGIAVTVPVVSLDIVVTDDEGNWGGMVQPTFREANLFDALIDTLDRLKNVEGKKSMLLLASGLDTFSSANLDDAIAGLRQSDVVVYSVGVGEQLFHSLEMGGGMSGMGRLSYLQAQSCVHFRRSPAAALCFQDSKGKFLQSWPISLVGCEINTRSRTRRQMQRWTANTRSKSSWWLRMAGHSQ